jgi:hypothetical protein
MDKENRQANLPIRHEGRLCSGAGLRFKEWGLMMLGLGRGLSRTPVASRPRITFINQLPHRLADRACHMARRESPA